MHLTI